MELVKTDDALELNVHRTTRHGDAYATMLQNRWTDEILRDFRWQEYMRAYPDLRFDSDLQARWHLIYNGYREGRLFDPDRCKRLDPGYYRKRYPELLLETDDQAQFHYCYSGYYENRFANADTEQMYNVDLHIYQHGRVGSHSIAAALKGNFSGSVAHMHWRSDMALYHPACSLPYSFILGSQREKPLRVISAGREVVSRVISGAFQFMESLESNETDIDVARMTSHLEDTFLHDCDVVTGWFDHQFHCGLDIYKHRFDHQKGYTHIGNSHMDLFLYRQENINQIEAPLAQFLELPELRLNHDNASNSKNYGESYRYFMRKFVLPKEVLREIYSTDYMQFFFSDDERRNLISYWSSPRATDRPR